MTFEEALGIVRLLIDRGISREDAIENSAIPPEHRQQIRQSLDREENIILERPRVLVSAAQNDQWLRQSDRSTWYYWTALREYLLGYGNWSANDVRGLDEVTNHILGQLAAPTMERFDIRGLVLGYVQSGKTANFTALTAKAADVGYRLIIVLSGIDNGLRMQTQIRLNRELVGYADNRAGVVRLPPMGKQWHLFTTEELEGDFHPGRANYGPLQGTQPVLLVMKKNGAVLRRLHNWLDAAPEDVRRTLPVLIIDDEADLASVDTRGTYRPEDEPIPDDYEEPSTINRLIRELLRKFQRRAYVAYTATPFANILIPHDTYDPRVENDLYPKDFIVALPKPRGYFGAEELFGRFDQADEQNVGGLDVVRNVSDEDMHMLQHGELPPSLESAMLDFVLAGATRAHRGLADTPATMLIHVSQRILEQLGMADRVNQLFSDLRDEWRYQRRREIRERLRRQWETEFRPVTRASHLERDATFEQIELHIGPFFESVQVRVINSFTGEVLDYQREPGLKAIAVGGNRLSRGLTLEGLLVSYFVRRSNMYDTLMQMGRWFGFRSGYDDLTRIYTTSRMAEWFSDLAFVEHRLREDLQMYEDQGLTPRQVGMRIWQHPTMQVTSRVKRRYANPVVITQSYDCQLEQTFKFPLHRLEDLAVQSERNLQTVRSFLNGLVLPHWEHRGPVWTEVTYETVLEFLQQFRVDNEVYSISLPLIRRYIEQQVALGELVRWTVAVRRRESLEARLGEVDWAVPGGHIWNLARSRLKDTDSLGVITTPGDEAIGLSNEALARMATFQNEGFSHNVAARQARPPEEGSLLLYPISKYSGSDMPETGNRRPLFENPEHPLARDLIGLAISFPPSRQPQQVEAYVEGTLPWRPAE